MSDPRFPITEFVFSDLDASEEAITYSFSSLTCNRKYTFLLSSLMPQCLMPQSHCPESTPEWGRM